MKPPKDPTLAAESTRKWWGCPGIVYFVAAGNPISAIKIGMAAQTGSNNLQSAVHRRLSQIQTSNHERIELIGLCYFTEGDYPTKDAEWFTAANSLLNRIYEISIEPEHLNVPRFYAEQSE